MSLINNMLQDLEHRRGGRPLQGHQILSGLDPVGMTVHAGAGWRHARPLTLIALVLAIPALAWLVNHGRPVTDFGWPVPNVGGGVAQVQRPFSTPGIGTGTVTEHRLAVASDGARVPIKPAAPVTDADSEVMVVNDTGVSVPVWFAPTPAQGALAPAREVRRQQQPASGDRPESVELALPVAEDLQAATRSNDRDASQRTSTLANIDTRVDTRTDSAMKDSIPHAGRFQRDASSTDDQVAMRLHEARAQLAGGHVDEALAGFRGVLRQTPGHTEARLELANTLVRMGRSGAALGVLEAGLKREQKAWQLALAEARILVARTEIGQAAKLLEANRPELEQAPEYYAYMAGLAQRQGDDDRAISLYRRITARDGARGVWWMGLAISLGRSDRRDEALLSFQHAMADKTLSINLRHYIGTQIAKLRRDGP